MIRMALPGTRLPTGGPFCLCYGPEPISRINLYLCRPATPETVARIARYEMAFKTNRRALLGRAAAVGLVSVLAHQVHFAESAPGPPSVDTSAFGA